MAPTISDLAAAGAAIKQAQKEQQDAARAVAAQLAAQRPQGHQQPPEGHQQAGQPA